MMRPIRQIVPKAVVKCGAVWHGDWFQLGSRGSLQGVGSPVRHYLKRV